MASRGFRILSGVTRVRECCCSDTTAHTRQHSLLRVYHESFTFLPFFYFLLLQIFLFHPFFPSVKRAPSLTEDVCNSSSYGVWVVTIASYLSLQLRLIPADLKHRQQAYLFRVFVVAVHITVDISEKSTGVVESFTIYGSLVLTASAYLMSLVLGGANDQGNQPRANPVTVTVLGLC